MSAEEILDQRKNKFLKIHYKLQMNKKNGQSYELIKQNSSIN